MLPDNPGVSSLGDERGREGRGGREARTSRPRRRLFAAPATVTGPLPACDTAAANGCSLIGSVAGNRLRAGVAPVTVPLVTLHCSREIGDGER